MKSTVFFSWQSDRPSKEGRNLIEASLKEAIAQLASDAEVEEAVRDGLSLDKDTQGVPGSPSIIDTIFNKIDAAAVFVADLTFVGTRSKDGLTPNPNVLIEYGWALKSLGRPRIIAVMNEAYGAPQGTLPFDLAHLRFPITYNLPEQAMPEERRRQREQLAKKFSTALKLVFTSPDFQDALPKEAEQPTFPKHESYERGARFRGPGPIGVTWNDLPGRSVPTQEVFLSEGAAMWLRTMPVFDPGRLWSATELRHAARSGGRHLLMPFFDASARYLRGEDGFGVFSYDGEFDGRARTGSVAYAFETGEVWSVDTSNLSVGQDKLYLESIVKSFAAALEDYGEFLQRLGLDPPFQWIAGLSGIKNRRLAVVPPLGHIDIHPGPECLADPITQSGTYEAGQQAKTALQPFFDLICRKCSRTYPNYPPFTQRG